MADEDGLSWLFELDSDVSGAKNLLGVLGNLDSTIKKLDAGLHKTDQASRAAGEGHQKHARGIRGLVSEFLSLEHHFGKIVDLAFEWKAAEFLLEMPKRVFDLGEEMVKAAAKGERLEKAFGLIFGDQIGRETLDYIESIGKYTEFSREQLKGAALDLAKVGFQGEGLKRALAASLDISAFSKSGAEGQGEALGALERIKNSGRVDRRTLRPLGISEGDFFKEMTLRTGKGRKELKAEMEKGTLDAETSLETLYTMITKRTHKDLGGAGVDMGKTMDATLNHLRELPDRYFERLAGTAGFEKLKETLGSVLEALDPDSPNGKRIFGALEEAFSFVADVISKIDFASVIETATEAMEGFEVTLAAAMSLLPGATGRKGDEILTSIATRRLAREHEARTGEKAAKSALVDPGYADDMKDLDDAAASGLLGEKSKVYNAAAAVGDAAKDGVRDKLEIHSPSVVFEDLGAMSAAGFGRGLRGGMDEAYAGIATPSLAARAGAGGGVTVHAPISITVGGHDGNAAAQEAELVSRLRAVLPSELQSAFEQIAGEAGT